MLRKAIRHAAMFALRATSKSNVSLSLPQQLGALPSSQSAIRPYRQLRAPLRRKTRRTQRAWASSSRPPQAEQQPQPPHTPREAMADVARLTIARFQQLENQARWRGYNIIRIVAAALGTTALLIYFNRDPIRESVSDEVAGVTKRSLSSQEVVDQANLLTKQVLEKLLSDDRVAEHASQFLVELFRQPETQQATVNLLVWVMKDPIALRQTQEFAGYIVDWLSKDPQTQANLAQLIIQVLQREDSHKAVVELTRNVLADPTTRMQTAQLVGDLMQYEVVKRESTKLGVYTGHSVMNDVGVQQHAVEFVKQVLEDPQLHKTGGNAIWSAVGYSVTPRLFGKWGTTKPEVVAPKPDAG
eukprot:TRINITY_DN12229_c5_g2_i2.p1 TRINITY_DN12229_c5_g2~~TRINITY_DN12229_c5_g2_i2.p1  ORF type:complete len:357 (+),score=80.74 TRINITY_DN12229_c5_g2_i2:815-1885(+)